ncbi:hypothetical protein CHS0354_018827 [Potamilus streckersoni]|uniref:Four-jointed n=1 Tax=Potamilus streckersoni TaxID=2493646 RepID=A0AAE0SEW8_9BIVA|nr:hypothetical protein CHS0354_018827 [Potamilus streckersoni]
MKLFTFLFMTGISFTLGLFLGLLIHLPPSSLPATFIQDGFGGSRIRRNLQTVGNVWSEPDIKALPWIGSIKQYSAEADYSPLSPGLSSAENKPQVGSSTQKSGNLETINRILSDQSDSIVYADSKQNKLAYNDTDDGRTGDHVSRIQGSIELNRKVGHLEKSAVEIVLDQRKNDSFSQSPYSFNNHNQTDSRFSRENILADGIFWAPSIELSCPSGFSSNDHANWKKKAKFGKIVKMEEGCGRMQNRLLIFQDASKACARYRLNTDQIQGEIYSYYLGKLLGIKNLAPSTLQIVNLRDNQWSMVHDHLTNSQWSEEKPVIFAQWIDNLSPAYIPHEFREQENRYLQPDLDYLSNKNKSELCELLQWSDLIIFDYLTANLDRVVNNMFNKQWNDQMMNRPAHNLEKSSDGHLVFLDNESGLFHGYRLLDKYAPFHQVLLDSLCVFRKSTIDTIERLVKSESIGDELQKLFEANEPLFKYIPKLQKKNIQILNQRLFDIYRQFQRCYSLYNKK